MSIDTNEMIFFGFFGTITIMLYFYYFMLGHIFSVVWLGLLVAGYTMMFTNAYINKRRLV